MSTQTQNKLDIVSRAISDGFIDSQFGTLDVSGIPLGEQLQNMPSDDSGELTIDPRFAQEDKTGKGPGSVALKNFLRSPDDAAVRQLAYETRNPALLTEIEEERRELEAKAFAKARAEYYPTEENLEALENYLAEHNLQFTSANLDRAFKALTQAGALEFAPQEIRPLSEEQRLEVTRYAQAESGQFIQTGVSESLRLAIERYIYFATGEQGLSPDRIMFDPKYRKLMDTAIFYCWCQARTDFTPTPERKRFFQEYAAGRPLSVPLLNQAWKACQKAENDYTRSSLLAQVEPTKREETDLNDLSDEAIDTLFHDVTRESLRSTIRR